MFTETAELYDLFYDWKDYAAEAERVHELVATRAPQARSLLDVACGTGRHLEHLRRWYAVEGLDLDDGLLAVARRRLPDVPFHARDMRTFDLGRRFDVVTCLFGSIGYVQTVDAMRTAIARMAYHLAPGGLLVLDPWLTPDAFDPMHLGRVVTVSRPDLEAVRLNDSRVEDGASVMDFHYLVARPGQPMQHLVETHALGLFTEAEYRAALEAAGLVVEHDANGLVGRGLWIGQATSR
jgi:SAM-dependent methyltransferase